MQLTGADGDEYRVFRRWYGERGPLDRRWRFRRPRKDDFDVPVDVLGDAGCEIEGGLTGIALAIAAGLAFFVALLLVVFVLLPVLGVAFEILLIVLFFTSGLFGRIVLRRPWIIEAQNLTDPAKSRRYAVRGWLRSSRAIAEIKRAIANGGPPAMLEGAELLPPADH